MKSSAEHKEEFAAFIGGDKHDICLKAAASDTLEQSVVQHSPEAIAA